MSEALRRLLRLSLAVAVVFAACFPMTAAASVSGVQVASPQLVAKGAEVDVTVSFTCTAGHTVESFQGSGVFVSAQEAVSKTKQAFGSGGGAANQVPCTGAPQSVVAKILANTIPPSPPFRVGEAVFNAFVQECDASFNCSFADTGFLTLRIRK